MRDVFDTSQLRRLRGVLRLAEARAEAVQAGSDTWQLAVPIDVLLKYAGMTLADIRWLIQRGLAEYRVETTRRGAHRRSFRAGAEFRPVARACFVLSKSGTGLAQVICQTAIDSSLSEICKPRWDPGSGDLTWRGMLVKRIRANAALQREVLKSCEASGWADEIDSPFARMPPRERSHYLGQVLYNLNRGQNDAHVHFSAFDKGRQFRWTEHCS